MKVNGMKISHMVKVNKLLVMAVSMWVRSEMV